MPLTDPGWNTLESLDEVPHQLQSEIAHFCTVYKQLENKHVEVAGWYSREDAVKEIEASRRRFREDASRWSSRVLPPCRCSRQSSSGSCRD